MVIKTIFHDLVHQGYAIFSDCQLSSSAMFFGTTFLPHSHVTVVNGSQPSKVLQMTCYWCRLAMMPAQCSHSHNQYFTVPKSIPLLPSATILVNMWSVILSSDMVSPWPTRYPFSKGLCFEVTVSYLTSFIYAIWSGHYHICFPPPRPCLATFGLQCCVWHSNLVFCIHQEFAISAGLAWFLEFFVWLSLVLAVRLFLDVCFCYTDFSTSWWLLFQLMIMSAVTLYWWVVTFLLRFLRWLDLVRTHQPQIWFVGHISKFLRSPKFLYSML